MASDELWKKVVDCYIGRGRQAAVSLLMSAGATRQEAEDNVKGAMKIYYDTNGNIPNQRSGNGSAARRPAAQRNPAQDRQAGS